ncbi:MAG: TrkA family potassium uptake protein [Anaerovoracaceae bacterium]
MRSILVIGLGRFGRHLATKLVELGTEVMIIDKDEKNISQLAHTVTSAQIGDCTDELVLKDLGVSNFDRCFVCISNDLESSLVITSLLKELGAKYVIAKVNQDIHAKFLLQNGADDVIYPERDMAQRTAMKYSASNAFDYIELTQNYAVFEIATPSIWIGKTIEEVDVRSTYKINVIAYKNGNEITPITSSTYTFNRDEHLIIAGVKNNFINLLDKKRQ